MDDLWRIWNRACMESPRGSLTQPGDRALADMMLFHGLAMNGGVLHALEVLSVDERRAALRGFRYFGLEATAVAIEEVADRWVSTDHWLSTLSDDEARDLEVEANDRYGDTDSVLEQAFRSRYNDEPEAFAPLDD
jgi:hypothetical protein